MEKQLTYREMLKVCEEINDKHLPDEQAFIDSADHSIEEYDGESTKGLLLKVFKQLLKTVDSEINEIEKKVNISPTCYKGCAHCCYFPIIVTRLEAKLISYYITSQPEERRQQIISHLINYYKTNQAEIDRACSLDFQEDASFKQKYIEMQLSCPFLDESSNTCMSYEVRPIPCRTYLNYCNPSVCAETHVPKEPFSYEFFHGFYMEELNVLLQDLHEDDMEVEGVSYPNDLFEYDYLPKLLKDELKL